MPEEFLEHETEEGRPGNTFDSNWASMKDLLDLYRPLKGCTKSIPITETFFSMQGEGPHMGHASFFVRTGLCNLECVNCIAEDVLVLYEDFAWKPIQDVKIGDRLVGAATQQKREPLKLVPSTVLDISNKGVKEVWELGSLKATPDHPVMKATWRFRFAQLQNFNESDLWVEIPIVEPIPLDASRLVGAPIYKLIKRMPHIPRAAGAANVYDLTTTTHNFIAGGTLVHNCDSAWSNLPKIGTLTPPESLAMQIHSQGWPHVTCTGGEPLIWQAPLALALQLARAAFWMNGKDLYVEIETNGTLAPSVHMISVTSKFIVSPKLSNMGETNAEKAIPFYNKSMGTWKRLADAKRAIFKFICSGPEDIQEIKGFVRSYKIPHEVCYLMPMGYSRDVIIDRSQAVMELCRQERFNFSSRLHILAWGNKKGT